MKLEKVTVNFQRKMNLGNYESADASCMLTAFVDPDDNSAEVQAELWRMAKENVKHALSAYRQDITVDELMLGLQIDQKPNGGVGDALTFEELANIYDNHHPGGSPARTLPIDGVYNWAIAQTELFWVHPTEETIHTIHTKETE